MKKIIYFHGYASSPESNTAKTISQQISDVETIPVSVSYSEDIIQQIAEITHALDMYVNDGIKLIFVGSSAGGFLANYFSLIYTSPAVLINPSLSPSKSFVKYKLPRWLLNQYLVIENIVNKFPNYKRNVNVFLGKDDDIVDPYVTEKLFSPHQTTFIDEGHRITKEGSFHKIINNIKLFI